MSITLENAMLLETIFGALFAMPLLEGWIVGASPKKVEVSASQVTQALLQGHARDFAQKGCVLLLFERGQSAGKLLINPSVKPLPSGTGIEASPFFGWIGLGFHFSPPVLEYIRSQVGTTVSHVPRGSRELTSDGGECKSKPEWNQGSQSPRKQKSSVVRLRSP
jgi:hypothetical protein